jgi:hypothetical protein
MIKHTNNRNDFECVDMMSANMYNTDVDTMSAIRRQRFGKWKAVFMGTPELCALRHSGYDKEKQVS